MGTKAAQSSLSAVDSSQLLCSVSACGVFQQQAGDRLDRDVGAEEGSLVEEIHPIRIRACMTRGGTCVRTTVL